LLCSQASLVKHGDGINAAKILYCRSWQCEICRPRRAKELIAQAIRGRAQRFLTITCTDATAPCPNTRAKRLVEFWRQIRVEIAANMTLPEGDRWRTPSSEDWNIVGPKIRKAIRDKQTLRSNPVPFLAVVEAQKCGNPHLHIMLRGDYIPQPWLKQRMKEEIGAEICDIRYVAKRRKLANYVAKYCGKDPHRFGTSKRYWQSPDWQLEKREKAPPWKLGDPIITRSSVSIEEFERAEHCYARKIFWEGEWVVSVPWDDDRYKDRTCEHDGCRHRHHGAWDE